MSRFSLISLLTAFLIPGVIFIICALLDGFTPSETFSALFNQLTVRRQNMLVVGLFGLFPVLLLLGILWLYRRSGGSASTHRAMAWGGFIPVILVLIWANFEYWRVFLPGRTYPGFPHGLEIVIGAGVFAPVLMVIGVTITWLVWRWRAE